MADAQDILAGVDALVFDAFGTTVDWYTTLTREIPPRSHGILTEGTQDTHDFVYEWRQGYLTNTAKIAKGEMGMIPTDALHRQLLDVMLASERWRKLADVWGDEERAQLTMLWHSLDGYSDVSHGLRELGKHKLVVTLSNGNARLLMDMAKHADLKWDALFSTEFYGAYKPNVEVYSKTAYHLSLDPNKIAMVAAHIWDLRAAAQAGFKTVYVSRPAEDTPEIKASLKTKKDGGEVDVIVGSFGELAELVEKNAI
ncbi:haloacid dehalogenase [Coniophora puteana RWD-64-598 SS2]|uniref:Haloacid dehalogenase n=1 Tax=Coniophora puteana (strain RWD-64-598) TaxID=741705 RepID=A0A5M3MAF6_CONPW|nr:haloacid dehalogenase [Coniophora puteana RWD-64-598 SS2]EIW75834.1 haloacid dehalogenase [Coniophora puteana RWD-64-598 SS2]